MSTPPLSYISISIVRLIFSRMKRKSRKFYSISPSFSPSAIPTTSVYCSLFFLNYFLFPLPPSLFGKACVHSLHPPPPPFPFPLLFILSKFMACSKRRREKGAIQKKQKGNGVPCLFLPAAAHIHPAIMKIEKFVSYSSFVFLYFAFQVRERDSSWACLIRGHSPDLILGGIPFYGCLRT